VTARGRSVVDVELNPERSTHAHTSLASRNPDPADHTYTALALTRVINSLATAGECFEMGIVYA
jgi:hypothetical protein